MRKNKTIPFGFIVSILLVSTRIQISTTTAHAQTEQDSQSLVDRLCQIVQDNSFLAIISGLTEALAICTGLTALNADQSLSQLCSLIDGLGIINTGAICGQERTGQSQIEPREGTNNDLSDSTPSMDFALEEA